jgi:hypothetical protein
MPTIIKTFTSSQGGVKNYLSTRSSSFSGWTNVGTGATGSTTTTAAELPELSVGTALKVTNGGSGSGYVESDFFQVDASDLGKLLGLTYNLDTSTSPAYAASDLQIQVWDATTSGGTYAQNTTLNVANVPSSPTGGTMQLSFSQNPSRPFTRIRIVRVAGLANSWASFSSITVTSATGGQSAAVSYIGNYTNLTTQGFGTVSSMYVDVWRYGSNIKMLGRFTAGTNTGVEARFYFPTGLSAGTQALNTTIIGKWWLNSTTSSQAKQGTLHCLGSDTYVKFGVDDYTLTVSPGTALNGTSLVSSVVYWVELEFPVAEWAGNGTVNLGPGAQVEYASNSTTSVTSNFDSFVYGPAGSLLPTGTAAGAFVKRVRFQYPIQSDDLIVVEVSRLGSPWYPIGDIQYRGGLQQFTYQSSTTYGMGIDAILVSSTDVDIAFGQYAYANSTYASAGTNWSGAEFANYRWRVRKAKASSPVGFGRATATDTGLVFRGRYQTKILSASVTGNGSEQNVTGLTFNNLTIGKTYRVCGFIYITTGVSNAQNEVRFFDGTSSGTRIGTSQINPIWANGFTSLDVGAGVNFIYTATTTTMTTTFTAGNSGSIQLVGNNTRGRSFIQLEEIDVDTTTAWT